MPTMDELLVRLGLREPEDPGTYAWPGAATGAALGSSAAALPAISMMQDLKSSRQLEELVRAAKEMTPAQMANMARAGDVGLSGKATELAADRDGLVSMLRKALGGDAPERLLRRGSMAASGSPLYHGFAISGFKDKAAPDAKEMKAYEKEMKAYNRQMKEYSSRKAMYDSAVQRRASPEILAIARRDMGMAPIKPQRPATSRARTQTYSVHSGNAGDSLKMRGNADLPPRAQAALEFAKTYRATKGTRAERLRAAREASKNFLTQHSADIDTIRGMSVADRVKGLRANTIPYQTIDDEASTALFRSADGPLDAKQMKALEEALATRGGHSRYAVPQAATAAMRNVLLPKSMRGIDLPGDAKRLGSMNCFGGHCAVAPNVALEAMGQGSKGQHLNKLPTSILENKRLKLMGVTNKNQLLDGFNFARRGRRLSGAVGMLGLGGLGALAGAAAGGFGGGMVNRAPKPTTIWDDAENWIAKKFN